MQHSETSIIRTPLGPPLTALYSETSIIRTPLGPPLTVLYSETSIIRTPLGPPLTVLFIEVSLFLRFYVCIHVNARDVKWGRAVVSC